MLTRYADAMLTRPAVSMLTRPAVGFGGGARLRYADEPRLRVRRSVPSRIGNSWLHNKIGRVGQQA